MTHILFFSEDTSFSPERKRCLRDWLDGCARTEKRRIGELNYIFCSDRYLRRMNKKFLDHDYFTDVITFASSSNGSEFIGGDIFISIDRVRDNAKMFRVKTRDECHRVMVHGLLHLCGYNDKTPRQAAEIRNRENRCMARRSRFF